MKQWIDRFKRVETKYLDNYLTWFLFVDSRSNERTKHNIKKFLLKSLVYEMTVCIYQNLTYKLYVRFFDKHSSANLYRKERLFYEKLYRPHR